jgi:eukaryotic-like serine/threonine-protein kinase
VVSDFPWSAVVRPGVARAYRLEDQVMQGPDAETARSEARVPYQDFLSLWKYADPDVPILKEPKAEHPKPK